MRDITSEITPTIVSLVTMTHICSKIKHGIIKVLQNDHDAFYS